MELKTKLYIGCFFSSCKKQVSFSIHSGVRAFLLVQVQEINQNIEQFNEA